MSVSISSSLSSSPSLSSMLNVNIGLLGHVDSGKTSLSSSLSSIFSTASLDKSPQSTSRGMTLDLGFSAFYLQRDKFTPIQWKSFSPTSSSPLVQFTLVDCPGHSSLLRTIIGGTSILDLSIIVIDATKGIQTQTAECIVLCEILFPPNHVIIALNKCDLLSSDEIDKMEKSLRKVFQKTKFTAEIPICRVISNFCAKGNFQNIRKEKENQNEIQMENTLESKGEISSSSSGNDISSLINCLYRVCVPPLRHLISPSSPFAFPIDHCFLIKGVGTIVTGTVLSGSVRVGDTVEFPSLRIERKVKSIQMFKTNQQICHQGDRAGICVTQLDPKDVERSILCSQNTFHYVSSIIIQCEKVRFFKFPIHSNQKFHISMGHSTVMAKAIFFREFKQKERDSKEHSSSSSSSSSVSPCPFDFSCDYEYLDSLSLNPNKKQKIFCVLQFDQNILCPKVSLFPIVASRLDTKTSTQTQTHTYADSTSTSISTNTNTSPSSSSSSSSPPHCRIGFFGIILCGLLVSQTNSQKTKNPKDQKEQNINGNENPKNTPNTTGETKEGEIGEDEKTKSLANPPSLSPSISELFSTHRVSSFPIDFVPAIMCSPSPSPSPHPSADFPLKLFKSKVRVGFLDKMVSPRVFIVKNLMSKGGNTNLIVGKTIFVKNENQNENPKIQKPNQNPKEKEKKEKTQKKSHGDSVSVSVSSSLSLSPSPSPSPKEIFGLIDSSFGLGGKVKITLDQNLHSLLDIGTGEQHSLPLPLPNVSLSHFKVYLEYKKPYSQFVKNIQTNPISSSSSSPSPSPPSKIKSKSNRKPHLNTSFIQ